MTKRMGQRWLGAGLIVAGLMLLAIFGITFEGGRSSVWLLTIGILWMLAGFNVPIVEFHGRIKQLEGTWRSWLILPTLETKKLDRQSPESGVPGIERSGPPAQWSSMVARSARHQALKS